MKAILEELEDSRKNQPTKRSKLFYGEWQMQQEFKLKPIMKNTSTTNVIDVDKEDKKVVTIEDEPVDRSSLSISNMSIEISDDDDDSQERVDFNDKVEAQESTHVQPNNSTMILAPIIQQPSATQITSDITSPVAENNVREDVDLEFGNDLFSNFPSEDEEFLYYVDYEPIVVFDLNEEIDGF
jgi:hypothetical protein